jgi:F0F1-type ATP synthase assembly protein I
MYQLPRSEAEQAQWGQPVPSVTFLAHWTGFRHYQERVLKTLTSPGGVLIFWPFCSRVRGGILRPDLVKGITSTVGQGQDRENRVGMRQVALLTAIPAILLVGPVFGWWFGSYLDRRFDTAPYLMITFIVLGFVASGRETWKLIKLATPPDREDRD